MKPEKSHSETPAETRKSFALRRLRKITGIAAIGLGALGVHRELNQGEDGKPKSAPTSTEFKKPVTKEDFVILMSHEQAEDYMKQNIYPLLTNILHNKEVLPGVSGRISKLFEQIQITHNVLYDLIPAYHPRSKTVIAKVDYDVDENKPKVMVFVPALMDSKTEWEQEGLNPEEIELAIGMVFGHEQIHLEQESRFVLKQRALSGGGTSSEAQIIEANAWATMIHEMIRPALELGKNVPLSFKIKSEFFRRHGDKADDPNVLEGFGPTDW